MRWKKQIAFCLCYSVAVASLWVVARALYPPLVQACDCAECTTAACGENGCESDCSELAMVSIAEYYKIDLNSASKEQLCLLSGIGEAKANYIIEYRKLVAPFETLEDVANVSGITTQMIQEWGDMVYVSPVK